VTRPLQLLANQLGAMRGGDFTLRVRGAGSGDALGLALLEANALSETLREQRMGAMEATALLRKVMEEIEVAVFAFDGDARLRLVNRAGERLLGQPRERLLGQGAGEVGLAFALEGESPRTLEHPFPGGGGRWHVRRHPFRQGGHPHRLLVISDLSRALREEERLAWQRLMRVLSHEINNSLAPIQSIAGTLQDLAAREPPPPDLRDDVRRGLGVIGSRARSLARFIAEYARLARLPPPVRGRMEVGGWVRQTAGLETRLAVRVVEGPATEIDADRDQLDQLLINMVRNAADAALETGGGVRAGWSRRGEMVEVWVEDDGPGLSGTANLFVPFFVQLQHRVRLVAQHAVHDLDPARLQVGVRLREDRALLEVQPPRVVAVGAADHAAHAAPEGGAQAHRAGLAGGGQLVLGPLGRAQGEGAEAVLGHHERHHLAVQGAVVQPHHEFIPTATSAPEPRSKTAAPKGPPVPRSTFSRDSSMARRIRSSSVGSRRFQSTRSSTQDG
jgi:two-component system, NtrC family, nitrogen regulation sensor histidine kinase NtrY